jgi:hypothetical protein
VVKQSPPCTIIEEEQERNSAAPSWTSLLSDNFQPELAERINEEKEGNPPMQLLFEFGPWLSGLKLVVLK